MEMEADSSARAERGAPLGVLIYGPFHVAWTALSYWLRGEGFPIGLFIGGVVIAGLLWYGLWRRSKGAWIAALILNALGLILGLGNLWLDTRLGISQVLGSSFVFAILLVPRTRAWLRDSRAAVTTDA